MKNVCYRKEIQRLQRKCRILLWRREPFLGIFTQPCTHKVQTVGYSQTGEICKEKCDSFVSRVGQWLNPGPPQGIWPLTFHFHGEMLFYWASLREHLVEPGHVNTYTTGLYVTSVPQIVKIGNLAVYGLQ